MTDPQQSAVFQAEGSQLNLTLYVAGDRPNSLKAQANLRAICEEAIPGGAEVEVVNVLADFARAAEHGIVVTPTLIVDRGNTSTVVIGTLSDRDKVLAAIGIESDQ
ncbi:MAG: circadian clock KaiB family protein [Phycisphaerae bacterium]